MQEAPWLLLAQLLLRLMKPSASLMQGNAKCKNDPPRTRTWNLRLRRPTPYPLGQRATCPHEPFNCEAENACPPMKTTLSKIKFCKRCGRNRGSTSQSEAQTQRADDVACAFVFAACVRGPCSNNLAHRGRKLPAVGIEPTFPPKCFR